MDKKKTYTYLTIAVIVTLLLIFAFDGVMAVLSVFKPLFYGIFIAYLLDGIVRLLMNKCKMKRGLSVAVTIVVVLLLLTLIIYYTIPFLVETIRDLVLYVSDLLIAHDTGFYNLLEDAAGYFNIDLDAVMNFDFANVDKGLLDVLTDTIQKFYGATLGTVAAVGSSVVMIISSFMMAVYMLIEKEDLLDRARRLGRAIVTEKNESYLLESFTMANDVFKRFIIGKSVDSLIVGLLIVIGFIVFGIEYGVVFGILCGIGNMIPYFGSIFAGVVVTLILLIINPWHALIAIIIILVVQQLDSHIIQPKVLSDNIGGVSAFWILFAVIISGMAFGFVGMILGVPVVVIVKNLVEDFVDRRLKNREKKPVKAVEKAEVTEVAQEQ